MFKMFILSFQRNLFFKLTRISMSVKIRCSPMETKWNFIEQNLNECLGELLSEISAKDSVDFTSEIYQ